MKFKYRALSDGVMKTGIIEAATSKEAAAFLKNNGFYPIDISATGERFVSFFNLYFNRVTQVDVMHTTAELAIMINAGLTLSQSLDILIAQSKKPSLRTLLTDIASSLKSGDSFSTALSKHPKHFSNLYISLVRAGELSGKLNEILARMAHDLEKQRQFISKLKSTMAYPIIVIIGVVGVIVVLLTVVVPQLLTLYVDLQIELPPSTQFLINASGFLSKYWVVILTLGAGIVYYVRRSLSTKSGQYAFYTLLHKIPLFGDIIKMGTLVSTTRTLSLLISSGILVLEGIGIVRNITTDVVFEEALRGVYKSIQGGLTISAAFDDQGVFPPILVQMTAVGERTGKLDEILYKVSDYFESESNEAIKTLTTLIEPAILVLLGGVVMFVVTAVLSPIYTLTSSIGQ